MLKKNDTITLDITDITDLGFGVGRHDGQVVFVSGCVPQDTADVKIIKVNKSYAVGRVEKITKKSPIRCEGRCDISECKSCAYKSIGYGHELMLKKEIVQKAFLREGLTEVQICDVIPSPYEVGYRNKAQYPISLSRDGEYVIGFYAPKSHRVTEARRCPLAPAIFGEILDTAADFFKKYSISVYDEETGKGLLRHIYLRRGEIGGEILLTFVINGDSMPFEKELTAIIAQKFTDVVGILINTNDKNTNVVLGDKWRTLYGRDHIFDTLGGVRLKITAPSFYQVNRAAADMLYSKAKELAAPRKSDTVLDLFCGAGSIGLSMADECGELVGIEIIDSAVKCARENADANGISHAKFYTGDASDTENLLENAERELGKRIDPDIIILDPPRAGCSEILINYVTRLAPKRIVYVSCNPQTLARDCKLFATLGYSCDEVIPFDLFPCTGHVESVVCLTRGLDVDMRRSICLRLDMALKRSICHAGEKGQIDTRCQRQHIEFE